MFHKQPKTFQDPQIDYPIDNLSLPFTDYIRLNKKILAEHRLDLNQHPEFIINANAPFELLPSHPIPSTQTPTKIKYGALLIHGLLDSCFMMKDMGLHLQSQGLLVRSILLPGHGTAPGSLLNTQYEDWLQALRYGITSLAHEVDQIFLVGFSTGASLSLYHTLKDSSHIAGLIMLAPAFKINSCFDFATNWYRPISRDWPRAKWLQIREEINYTKYCSMPFNAAYQVYRLGKALKKIHHHTEPACPLFICLSHEDKIVCSTTTMKYFLNNTHSKNRMLLYTNTPYTSHDSRIRVKNSAYPQWHIENFSHISLPIAPDNFHYGKNGDYPLASHIEKNHSVIYCELDSPSTIYYDALYQLKLTRYRRQRLTFNPDFAGMMKEIENFIDSLRCNK